MKLAVIFPGIGYHTDKPLLYYSKKIASAYGYEIVEVPYKKFPKNVRGDKEKMIEAFQTALEQTEEILREIDFNRYEKLLFISKSIGTIVASVYADKHQLKTNHIFYTPVGEFFQVPGQSGIVFHGTGDPWVTTDTVRTGCEAYGLPLYVTKEANHSLETGRVARDIENLRIIMEQTENYIKMI